MIVSGLSVRGVIVAEEEGGRRGIGRFAEKNGPGGSRRQLWMEYRRESARANGDVMKDLAEGTGGTFFHNNNDLEVGFERLAAAPEFSYVLGFSSADLKKDGSYHSLKVHVSTRKGVTVEARRGYYALVPDTRDNAAAEDIADAVFSRDEITDIPAILQVGYSRPYAGDAATVQLLAKIDVTSLHYRKSATRSNDSLRAVAALFDPDGGYVAGATETVTLKLLDETLAQKDPALTLRWEFPDIKPGSYQIRLVINEPGSKAMTTMNRPLKIL